MYSLRWQYTQIERNVIMFLGFIVAHFVLTIRIILAVQIVLVIGSLYSINIYTRHRTKDEFDNVKHFRWIYLFFPLTIYCHTNVITTPICGVIRKISRSRVRRLLFSCRFRCKSALEGFTVLAMRWNTVPTANQRLLALFVVYGASTVPWWVVIQFLYYSGDERNSELAGFHTEDLVMITRILT